MMPPAKSALRAEPNTRSEPIFTTKSGDQAAPTRGPVPLPVRLPNALAGSDQTKRPVAVPPLAQARRDNGFNVQGRVPVITGEVTYRGWLPVDGVISGQMGANGSALIIKQRPRNATLRSEPELNGEICFKDMLRVNGHVAGRVLSEKGTLIVDSSARVDADIDVAIAVISGTVNGAVVGHERVELGPESVINGSISTRSLSIKPGAVFHGDCRMLKNENGDR